MNDHSVFQNRNLYQYCVINDKLLDLYKTMKCACCGSRNKVYASHKVRKEKLRLDCVELLDPLCNDCHSGDDFPDSFIVNHGIEKYNRFFNVDVNFVNKIIEKYISDGRAILISEYEEKVKSGEVKKRNKIQSNPMPFGRHSKYKKTFNNGIQRR